MHVKKNDEVTVICGNDRGKTGKVLAVICKKDQIVVEGVNMRFRHVKRSQQNPQGGRLERESPIHVSNVKVNQEQ